MESSRKQTGHQFTGMVLAGGRSSRFGRDKGLYPYLGKPMVEHALDILGNHFDSLCISTNDPGSYAYLNLPLLPDIHRGCGPLGGLHAGLKLPGTGIAVLSCDMPHVPGELFEMLLQNLDGHLAVVPAHGQFREATCAIYTSACLPAFEKALMERRYKIMDALAGVAVNFVDVSEAIFYHPQIFHNINYRADL